MRCCGIEPHIFGVFMGVFLLSLSIITLSFPWYYMGTEVNVNGSDSSVLQLYSWRQMYCHASGPLPCSASTTDWYDKCGSGCAEMKKIFDTTLALLIIACLMSVPVCMGYLYYYWSVMNTFHSKQRQQIHVNSMIQNRWTWRFHLICSIIVTVFSGIAVIVFGAGIPKAFKDDNSFCFLGDKGPCESLYGSYETTFGVSIAWGAAGFLIGIVFCVLSMIGICASQEIYSVLNKRQGEGAPAVNLSSPYGHVGSPVGGGEIPQ